MGNCQAIDTSTILIQHPNGTHYQLYSPVLASDIINTHPGHYVALLLTTTLYSSTAVAPAAAAAVAATNNSNDAPLRITRVKLLKPTDTLLLGHVYRLVTTEELMKGLRSEKQSKMEQKKQKGANMAETQDSDFVPLLRRPDMKKNVKAKQEKNKSRNITPQNSATSKSRTWQPALNSIFEAPN